MNSDDTFRPLSRWNDTDKIQKMKSVCCFFDLLTRLMILFTELAITSYPFNNFIFYFFHSGSLYFFKTVFRYERCLSIHPSESY